MWYKNKVTYKYIVTMRKNPLLLVCVVVFVCVLFLLLVNPFIQKSQHSYNRPIMSGHSYDGYSYINQQLDQYPQYYDTQYSIMDAESEQCISLPKVSATCINRKLVETGGDMAQSIEECRVLGKVKSGCKYRRCKNEYYPYMPQYVTLKKIIEYPVDTSLNAPKPRVMLEPEDQ